jgi:Fur family transcriptional regulator, peroxide stress response regulator
MNDITIAQRQTKYCQAIEVMLADMGHATNNELLIKLRNSYPDLSATTVHRASARLAARGTIAIAPTSHDGSMRYDTNVVPHDHFLCTNCGMLRDTDVKDKIIPILESTIGDCHISGRLTISGICKKCKEETNE